jgi:glycosyltransferase involved in cell wall biosynthesis
MRILFIAEPGSIHAARWIQQFKDCNWDIHISTGSTNSSHVCDEFNYGTIHHTSSEKFPGEAKRGVAAADSFITLVQSLASLIDTLRPDVIHILGICVNMENRAIPLIHAMKIRTTSNKIPIVYSSWGTDLDYVASIPAFRPVVQEILSQCNFHLSECDRDIRLARALGFTGRSLGKLPAFGGTTWVPESFPIVTPSQRELIYIKARDALDRDPIGRASTAINSLLFAYPYFTGKSIGLFQSGDYINCFAEQVTKITSLNIRTVPRLPSHRQLVEALSLSCIYTSITINDGLPSTLVEAMSVGAFPIHSNLEPIREWITDGENGLLVEPDDVAGVAKAFKRALTDSALVNRAAQINVALVKNKLSDEVVKPKSIALYSDVVKEFHNG